MMILHKRSTQTSSVIAIAGVLLGFVCDRALAQGGKPAATSQLGVDVVTLKSGKTVRGAILRQDARGSLTMAVPRDWLKQANVELLEKLSAEEATSLRAARVQLRDRLKQRLEVPPESKPLAFFLQKEFERVEQLLEKSEDSESDAAEPLQFVWFELQRDLVAKVVSARPERQQVALWAWSERLPGVATRDVAELTKELNRGKVDPTKKPPELWDRLPTRPQDDREWMARMAIIEYGLSTPVDYQGTGDILVRSNGERDLQTMAPVISKVLRGQVDSLLKDLLGESTNGSNSNKFANNDWLKTAYRDTERLNAKAFRATRVDVNPDGRQASVHSVFVVRVQDDQNATSKWETIWSHQEAADASKARPDDEARISSDPQVKQALSAVKSLGLGAEDQIEQAIRFGAATMAAQKSVDSRFFELRDRYLKRLDGPPLWKSDATPRGQE